MIYKARSLQAGVPPGRIRSAGRLPIVMVGAVLMDMIDITMGFTDWS